LQQLVGMGGIRTSKSRRNCVTFWLEQRQVGVTEKAQYWCSECKILFSWHWQNVPKPGFDAASLIFATVLRQLLC
jgi:hypothetical protein